MRVAPMRAAAALAIVLLSTATTVSTGSPASALTAVELNQPAPITRDHTQFSITAPQAGALYDAQVRSDSMLSSASADQWRILATGTTSTHFTVRAEPGRVVCVRARMSGEPASEWGIPRCVVRPLDDSALTASGPHLVIGGRTPARSGTVLRPGGQLTLAGVPAGASLVLGYQESRPLGSVPHWGIVGQPEPTVTHHWLYGELGHRVAVGGTARIWADPAIPTYAIRSFAVVAAWVPIATQVGTGTDPESNAPQGRMVQGLPWVTLASQVTYAFDPLLSTQLTHEFQVASGSMLAARPAWRDHPVPRDASSFRVPIRPGTVVCIRSRAVGPGGVASPWLRQCTVRPLDDHQARASGRRVWARDPIFRDHRASRVGTGSWLHLGRVARGAWVGSVIYPSRVAPIMARPAVDGRGSADAFYGNGWPSNEVHEAVEIWFSPFRRAGQAAIGQPRSPYGGLSERVAGVWTLPRWAQDHPIG